MDDGGKTFEQSHRAGLTPAREHARRRTEPLTYPGAPVHRPNGPCRSKRNDYRTTTYYYYDTSSTCTLLDTSLPTYLGKYNHLIIQSPSTPDVF